MKTMRFIGRKRELKLLNRLNEREGAQLLILYGRRRIGKTALLGHWATTMPNPPRTLYWMATQTSSTRQLRDFSQAIHRFISPDVPVAADFNYLSWEVALRRVAQLATEERIVLILDEITYVMQADPEVPSLIQRVWDHHLKDSNLFLILTGSLAGLIQRAALDYHAPLYGRATAQLKLQPLPFAALTQFLPAMTTAQRIAVYALTGGIPTYIEQFSDDKNIRANLEEQVVSPANIMLNDGAFLLREQVEEPRNYVAVIEAISGRAHRLTEIAKTTGIPSNHVTKYLAVLRELGYVERIVPATVQHPERSKKGRYVLVEPYLRFYYRFLHSHVGEITYGRTQAVIDYLTEHLVGFIGTHTFEELCREWIHLKVDMREFPFIPDRVGSFWSAKAQVDVVAINRRTKQILLGECKWGKQPIERTVIDKLLNRTEYVLPTGNWQTHYALFGRSQPTTAAQQKIADHNILHITPAMIEQDGLRWMNQ